MEILNKTGLEVLQYKEELLNSAHSDIVVRALHSAITNLLSGEIITIDLHDALKDEGQTIDEIRKIVLTIPNLRKTESELKTEYDAIRVPFFQSLLDSNGLSDPSFAKLTSESHVNLEEVQFILSFEMPKSFIGQYFERDAEQLEQMMRADGFAEKFAILRYSALMNKYLKSHDSFDEERKRAILSDGVEIGATKVYVNKDEKLYGVELVYHVPISLLEDEEKTEQTLMVLEKNIQAANEFVNIRTIA